jgi:polysaccharide deacetylase family protein (PEP-CTERM system associated)
MTTLAFSVDFEDWYHGIPISASGKERAQRRLERSGHALLDLMAEHDVRGTFFLLGPLVEAYPSLVRRIADDGHEIGCHGWSHDLLYEMERDRLREETRRAKGVIEDVTGREVRGYRAAYFSIVTRNLWALEVLAELGFCYDSSIFPVVNWRYGIPDYGDEPRSVTTPAGEILEFPISVRVRRGRNVPVSGGAYFRIYPYAMTRKNLEARVAEGKPTTFYIHPWELDPGHPRVRFHWKAWLTHYANLGATAPRLGQLFRDFDFTTTGEVLERCLQPS